jgi:hypothetical protein
MASRIIHVRHREEWFEVGRSARNDYIYLDDTNDWEGVIHMSLPAAQAVATAILDLCSEAVD